MGGKSPEETGTQELFNREIVPDLERYVDDFSKGEGLYQGSVLADESADVQASRQRMMDMLPELRRQIGNSQQTLQGFLDYDPNSTQNQASRDVLGRNISQQFNRSIRPGIENRSTFAGQFGGPQSSLALGQATEGLSDSIAMGELGLMNADRNRAMQALSLSPSMIGLNLLPEQIQGDIGTQRQGRDQQELLDQIQQFEAPRRGRFQSMQEISGLLGGGGGPGAPAGPNVLQGALGGAATGAAITPGSPIGAIVGGGIGALGTLL
jgi:hypothetical protein